MDSVSAFGIAANVFAVVDFASKVINVAVQIHETGDSDQLTQAESAAKGLEASADLIVSQAPPLFTSQAPPEEDHVFVQLAEASVTISSEILRLLDKTFRAVWNQDTLNRLKEQLSDVRETLQVYAVVSIKTKLEKDSLKLDQILLRLDEGTKASVPGLLNNFGALKTQGDEIIANQLRGEELAELCHEQLLGSLGEISLNASRPRSRQSGLTDDEIREIQRTILLSL